VALPGGAVSGSLSAGGTQTITVRVTTPPDIVADSTDHVYLFATSVSNLAAMGVNRGTLDVQAVGIFEEENGVPERYYLAQNYPNPFNASTAIAFGLKVGGQTTVTVYNLLGQSVAVLLDEYQSAGRHLALWDGKDRHGQTVPTGVYFYRIRSAEFAETRKMVLMK